jgi:hypothetical protein
MLCRIGKHETHSECWWGDFLERDQLEGDKGESRSILGQILGRLVVNMGDVQTELAMSTMFSDGH